MSLDDLRDLSPSDDKDDVDSLPSTSTSDLYSEPDSDAQAEWERSLDQLQLLLTMMIIPFAGKYLGRKFAFWSTHKLSLLPLSCSTLRCSG